MENQDYSSVMGDGNGTSEAPYIASLLAHGATIPNFHGRFCGSGSENNYIALLSGDTWGCPGNGARDLGDHNTGTLVNLFENKGITWHAFCESTCGRNGDHFPFLDFTSIVNNSERMSHLDAGGVTTQSLVNMVKSASPPDFIWWTPEDDHNMHDNSVSSGDSYLSRFVPDILSSPIFTTGRALFLLWWDEYNLAPIAFVGPTVKQGYISQKNNIDHYSITRMIETNWNLSSITPHDANAAVPVDIFGTSTPPPPRPLTGTVVISDNTPTVGEPITFTGKATGGTGPYSYGWNFGDGATASGARTTHTYSSARNYTAILTIRDSNRKSTTVPSKLVRVTSPVSLSVSISYLPADPTTGQTVIFTAIATGGTPPYVYRWNFGGENNAVGPAATNAYANPGAYAVNLTVTDSSARTANDSVTITVTDISPPPTPTPSTVPVIVGWGGSRLDEAVTYEPSNRASEIFTDEQASNQEVQAKTLSTKGLNAIRVSFESQCTSYQEMGAYNSSWLSRSITIAKHYHMWIIVDYHGYSDLKGSDSAACWLSFWQNVVQEFRSSYDMIVWEPLNEPTGIGDNIQYLSQEYQLWVDQVRSLNDTHWIVVQNICSYGCGLSNMADGFPTVTDPAGTIFISLHSYMSYSEYSSNWNNATAESVAQGYYQAVLDGMDRTGWPALNTEGGADELCDNCAPDEILTGSAGYTQTTLHFIQALTTLYDANRPNRINWVWWTIGSWTNTPDAGLLGSVALNGWGSLLQYAVTRIPSPRFLVSDLNGDCKVDMLDVDVLLPGYLTSRGQPRYNPIADINDDGRINILDAAELALDYGQGCQ